MTTRFDRTIGCALAAAAAATAAISCGASPAVADFTVRNETGRTISKMWVSETAADIGADVLTDGYLNSGASRPVRWTACVVYVTYTRDGGMWKKYTDKCDATVVLD
jgi:hypothetical protein